MNKKLLESCRYYKGESECPQNIKDAGKESLWQYELFWAANFNGTFDDNGEYEWHLKDFESNDGVPITLKRVLFNRFIQGAWNVQESVEPFKTWYNNTYKGSH